MATLIGAIVIVGLLGLGVYLLTRGRTSSLASWRWPIAQGQVVMAEIEYENTPLGGPAVLVSYKFRVGDDGPYTGDVWWSPKLSTGVDEKLLEAERRLFVGCAIDVRYKPSDPTANTADVDKVMRGV